MSLKLPLNTIEYNVDDERDYIDIYGVRIAPPRIMFRDAFEGRTYKQKLSIQNIKKSKVFIRTSSPSSYAFKMKPIKSRCLSPGMSVVTEVSFIYTHLGFPSCTVSIYINENCYVYYIFAKASAAEVSITPTSIDFGMVDAGFTSTLRTLLLENSGSKATRFYIDYAKNAHQIIVEPNKGLLQPKSSLTIHIRLISSVEGHLNMAMWIKCEKPLVVPISGVVIKPKFELINIFCGDNFTLIDFPITYVGITSVRTIFIRNYSAEGTTFCFMGEKDEKFEDLKICQESDGNFKYFDVFSKDGFFQSKEIKVFQFRFEPKKLKKNEELLPFYFCTLNLCRIRCKYLLPSEYAGGLFETEDDHSVITTTPSLSASILLDCKFDNIDGEQLICKTPFLNDSYFISPVQERDCIKFYMHGMAEQPSVNVIPNEFILTGMLMGERQTRVLELQNRSPNLPIFVSYKKAPYIILEKDMIFIKPLASVQVSVFVTCFKIGQVNSRIRLDLMYYDYPRVDGKYKVIGKISVPVSFEIKSVTKLPPVKLNDALSPEYIREVGKFCHNVTFNSQIAKPRSAMVNFNRKNDDALIAFPNDTQKSLRPWRNNMLCKTIFAGLPRYSPPIDSDYELTVFNRQLKIREENYYSTYVRREAERLRLLKEVPEKLLSDYDLTNEAKLLCRDIVMRCSKVKPEPTVNRNFFIPLTPLQMNNIIIHPSTVHAGPIVAHRNHYFEISIKNNNLVSVRIFVKADKANILFPDGNRRVIKPQSEISLSLIYIAPSIGFYTTSLDIVVNECVVFAVTLLADVCSSCLKLSTYTVEFVDDQTRAYIEMFNPFNASISYNWLIHFGNFTINPMEGIVSAKSTSVCCIDYLPYKEGPSIVDVEFYSGDASTEVVRLLTTSSGVKLFFLQKELVFENMPLNIPVVKKAVLVNKQHVLQAFSVIENELSGYMEVLPKDGVIYGDSQSIVTITLKLTSCVEFATTLKFYITTLRNIELPIRGNVVYPTIDITPKVLQFKKIPCSTTDVICITVENRSEAVAKVKFDISNYKEYKISTSRNHWITDAFVSDLILEGHNSKNLFVHFVPTAASNESFLLPIIINDMLGPLVDELTMVNSYIMDIIPNTQPIRMLKFLPQITVNAYAMEPKIIFSKFTINLTYDTGYKKFKNSYQLKIRNPQNETEDVCIRIDNLQDPMILTHTKGPSATLHEKSIVCSLNPKEEVVFTVTFKPCELQPIHSVLPVYLKSDMSAKPHNMLIIKGDVLTPEISSDCSVMYVKPLPLQAKVTGVKRFIFRNHFNNCAIRCNSDLDELTMTIVKSTYIDDNSTEVTIRIGLEIERPTEYCTTLNLLCSCGARCTLILIGCIENCFLTNYAIVNTFMCESRTSLNVQRDISLDIASKPSMVSDLNYLQPLIEEYDITGFFTDYPKFPNDDSYFQKYMECCVDVMEKWIYTQGFYGRSFYKIPEGINYVLYDKPATNLLQDNKDVCLIPYIQLLKNLVDNQAEKWFAVELPPSDEVERALYFYEIYKKAIIILRDLGAFLPYLHPEYLLEYSMYNIYMTKVFPLHPEDEYVEVSSYDDFYRLAKQSWLDIILQTYKVLVLHRLGKFQEIPKTKSLPHEKFRNFIRNSRNDTNLFSYAGILLLKWMEFHYDEVRTTLWSDNEFLGPRHLMYFGQSLGDGFVFAAVTIAYCPYLERHFRQLHEHPEMQDDIQHNNIIVLQAWELLNFSLHMSLLDTDVSHSLINLVLINYLFEVLPNMYPSETIEFIAGLSQTKTHYFQLKNENAFPVAYKLIFVENDDGCFEIINSMHVIHAKGSQKIRITYTAKFAKDVTCTLVLSGECKGYRYAKSKALTLVGKPDITYMTTVIQTSLPLHTTKDFQFSIKSPYKVQANYKIQYTTSECTSVAELNLVPYRGATPHIIVTRLYPIELDVEFNNNGVGYLDIMAITISYQTIPTWIYFRNDEVGDFGIKIVVSASFPVDQDVVTIVIPKNLSELSVNCKRDVENVLLKIPCQNKFMWMAIARYMLRVFRKEMQFWRRYIRSTAGMHALQKLLRLNGGPHTFDMCKPNTYNIKVGSKSTTIKLPKYIEVEDESSSNFVSVPIKIDDANILPKNFSFTMKSVDGLQVRRFRTNFVHLCPELMD